jgi:hypothetical protein
MYASGELNHLTSHYCQSNYSNIAPPNSAQLAQKESWIALALRAFISIRATFQAYTLLGALNITYPWGLLGYCTKSENKRRRGMNLVPNPPAKLFQNDSEIEGLGPEGVLRQRGRPCLGILINATGTEKKGTLTTALAA